MHDALATARQMGERAAIELDLLTRLLGEDVAHAFSVHGSPLTGDWRDGISVTELFQAATGLDYPDNLTETLGDVVASLVEAHETGFAAKAAELSHVSV